ncbi:MAG: Zn-ribbon domain-containing OB-fold protein [Chloroflexi bacterium]|nr:Zn-ribbon domain-containing OB-fold protein [Chloroflexota bacterium]
MEHKLSFKQYNEALKQNKLLGLKCKQCGNIIVPPKIACGNCSSTELDIVELSGKGKIQTFTTVFVAPEGREGECPYVIVLVELDEGPWIMGNLTGIDPSKVTMEIMGKKVQMGHAVFPGDKYSAGDEAKPLFSLGT